MLLVGIELGGLMRSTDGGATWQDHRPGAQRDVHSLAWHPQVEGRAYEAGGGGAAWSEDAGETWHPADDGRDRHYTWSVASDPADPDTLVRLGQHRPVRRPRTRRPSGADLSASQGGLGRPHGWAARASSAMPYALLPVGERLFAGLADGQLWETGNRGDLWRRCSLAVHRSAAWLPSPTRTDGSG